MDLPSPRPRLAFAFSTRGPRWAGLGRDLFARDPVFRETLGRCGREIRRRLGWRLEEELHRDPAEYRLDTSEEHIEPALLALQIALCDTLAARGVRPGAVISMSAGEIAAAYAAGVLDLPAAMALACGVGRCFRRGLGRGAMLSVAAARHDLEGLWHLFPEGVHVATEYSPTVTVLSGQAEAVGTAQALLTRCGLRVFPVRCGFALHSPLCDGWESGIRRAFRGIGSRPPAIPVYSALAGGRLASAAFDSRHWWNVLRAPARTAQAARSAVADGYDLFLEIGPQPTLARTLQEAADLLGREVTLLATMLHGRDSLEVIGESLAILSAQGATA